MYNNNFEMIIKRGDIFYCDIGQGLGSEQCGKRPCVIIQNNLGNKYSPNVIVAAITSQVNKTKLPTHVEINLHGEIYGLSTKSVVLCEQIRTISKKRLLDYVGRVTINDLKKINTALRVSIGSSNNREHEVIDLSHILKVKERMLLDSINTGAPKQVVKYLETEYINSFIRLEDICISVGIQVDNYYVAEFELEDILSKKALQTLQTTMDLDMVI